MVFSENCTRLEQLLETDRQTSLKYVLLLYYSVTKGISRVSGNKRLKRNRKNKSSASTFKPSRCYRSKT